MTRKLSQPRAPHTGPARRDIASTFVRGERLVPGASRCGFAPSKLNAAAGTRAPSGADLLGLGSRKWVLGCDVPRRCDGHGPRGVRGVGPHTAAGQHKHASVHRRWGHPTPSSSRSASRRTTSSHSLLLGADASCWLLRLHRFTTLRVASRPLVHSFVLAAAASPSPSRVKRFALVLDGRPFRPAPCRRRRQRVYVRLFAPTIVL